ncbi:MAG: ABC transporter substrate-binding protein [Pseudonocardia sp.]
MSIGGDEGTLTPFTYVTGDPGFGMLAMVYDNLLTLDRNNEVQPLLATGLLVSADGLTYTLPLTEGVTWHDGRPFRPEDVAFSVNYYKQHPSSVSSGIQKIRRSGSTGAPSRCGSPDRVPTSRSTCWSACR